MSESDEITRLRAENERLLKENFSLSAWQCEFADGKTGLVAHEHGGTYCAMATKVEQLLSVLADTRTDNMRLREWNAEIALNGRELVAENERLRAALKPFVCDCEGEAICIGECMHRNARAALDGQPAPGKEEA